MKKIKLSLLILILILTIGMIFIAKTQVNAEILDPSVYEPDELQEAEVEDFETFGATVGSVVQIVGTMVSVGTIIIIGIRYVIASADEKAEYRERMIPYLIGAVLLFGASNIVNVIYGMF